MFDIFVPFFKVLIFKKLKGARCLVCTSCRRPWKCAAKQLSFFYRLRSGELNPRLQHKFLQFDVLRSLFILHEQSNLECKIGGPNCSLFVTECHHSFNRLSHLNMTLFSNKLQ
jgi:hypothetical protein